MTPEQISGLLALAPGLTVQGLLVLFSWWLLRGEIRSKREFDAMEARYKLENEELRKQRDRYEGLAWKATDIAARSTRVLEEDKK